MWRRRIGRWSVSNVYNSEDTRRPICIVEAKEKVYSSRSRGCLLAALNHSFCVRPHPSSLLSSGRPVDRSDHVQTEKSMRRRRRQHGRRAALSRRSNLWNLFSTFYVQRSTTASLETIIIIKYIRVNRILTKNGPRDNMSCFCCPSTLTVWWDQRWWWWW